MTLDKISEQIYAFRYSDQEDNELYRIFEQWNNVEYLYDFFESNSDKLLSYFHIKSIEKAIDITIDDAEELEYIFLESDESFNFDTIFRPLHNHQYQEMTLSKNKAKREKSTNNCWLRIYAIRVESNLYIITGGAIKLTHLMEDEPHTKMELIKMEQCRNFLKDNGVFDLNSFNDYLTE